MLEREEMFWKYDSEISAYVIYFDRPMPAPYNANITEIWRLTMRENALNSLIVREIVEEINSRV